MIIYEATTKDFLNDVLEDKITDNIYNIYQSKIGKPHQGEVRAWQNSMQYMYKVLSGSKVPEDSGVAIEFRIPLTANRIDFILSGYNGNEKGEVVLIELKQWDDINVVTEKDGLVETALNKGMRETSHPSYQILSYKNLISDFNESVQEEKIFLTPCAYLHNFEITKTEKIKNIIYKKYVDQAPVFLKGQILELREFIEKHIVKGDNRENLYEINSGKIRPAKALQDVLSNMLKGNQEFHMIDSQKVIYENAFLLAKKSQEDDKKRVLIVEGPGTGKSVLAVNLLVSLLKQGIVSQYVSKNAAPRNVYSEKLKGDHKTKDVNHLFRGSGSYHCINKNAFGALVVDETHRLNEKSGMFKNMGENQIKEIINASKFSAFFIDENQRVDLSDIGSKKEIEKYAKALNAEVSYYLLESQFRCNGSDGYLAWLDNILQIHETANLDFNDFDYDFKVFDDVTEFKNAILEKNKINNKARIVAGYCWDWLNAGKTNSNIFDIEINDFKMSWNLSNTKTWAIDPESVNEVGCIHTSQGLEFDYVGVIIGEDLRFENDKITTDYSKRARTDNSLKGIKKMLKENPKKAEKIADEIIKNTYRTLMTRGQKGCYIYCCDKKLTEYFKKRLN